VRHYPNAESVRIAQYWHRYSALVVKQPHSGCACCLGWD
jgi:hypothetical protein